MTGPSDAELFRRAHEDGDVRARELLVERYLPLARRLARRYQNTEGSLEDLVQVASIGLLKATDRFDPKRGIAFSSYAVPTILGELKRHFRDRTWSVRVPRELQELVLRVDHAIAQRAGRAARAPSVGEIARE
ncbi:MAG TPA: sigma-70 family RNA polymerase sigma factor, partial [Solirubrobacteraceae bacterium]|nr:sigma-70 family RNA polymerase sigma factor [Solirubrobacteraceae bacterium]